MLRWAFRLLILLLLCAGWTLAAAAMHVVVVPAKSAAEGDLTVLVVPKNRLSFAETYVDARGWSVADLPRHEALVSRLIEAGHAERLSHVLSPEQRRRLEEMLRIRRAAVAGEP